MVERTLVSTRPFAALGALLAALLDWRPIALAGLCVVLIILGSQAPLRYDFAVGRITGPGSDLPFLQGFHPPESLADRQTFRWSKAQEAAIVLPGIGRRGAILGMEIISHRAQWDHAAPPTVVTLQSEASAPLTFALRLEGAHYVVFLPPAAADEGTLRLSLRTDVWQKPGDSRDELGVALGQHVTLLTTPAGLVVPDRGLLWSWPAGLALLWVALRALRFSSRLASLLLLPLVLSAPLLLLLDAPRLGFGSLWMLQVSLLVLLAALICAWAVARLLARLGAPAPASLLPWLMLLVALSFALKYGGRLYPDAMPGDIQLHVNRYSRTIMGEIYIPAQHRGLPFPFPTGPYLLIAPLTLLGFDVRFLLPFVAGLLEAATVLLLYLIGARALGRPRLGLLAGAIYAVTSAGFMTTWFAFETQVAAQWFTSALLALLVLAWPRYDGRRVWWLTLLLLLQVFLGHIGLFINVTLLGLLVAPLLWLRASGNQERRAAGWLLLAGVVAVAFALLFFYSGFTGLILDQLGGMAAGGLNGATGRNPIPRATTLWVTWEGGVITHFGFFPVLLAGAGMSMLAYRRGDQDESGRHVSILTIFLAATLLVSLSQAALPLITLSSITTRWLMFSAWAIAVAGALGVAQLWRCGRAARLITVVMSLYVGWLTIVLFVEALALRKPPIEPF